MTAVVDVCSQKQDESYDVPNKLEGEEDDADDGQEPTTFGTFEDEEQDKDVIEESE